LVTIWLGCLKKSYSKTVGDGEEEKKERKSVSTSRVAFKKNTMVFYLKT
jgi:hypothetical protein